MGRKKILFCIATILTLTLSTTHAQVTNARDGMEHIIQVHGRLAMTFNTKDEIFSPALRKTTETINTMETGQTENIYFDQTAVNLEILEAYKNDDGLPCKRAFMKSKEEDISYYIYVCHQADDSDQVTLQSDLNSVLRQKQ